MPFFIYKFFLKHICGRVYNASKSNVFRLDYKNIILKKRYLYLLDLDFAMPT